MAVELPAATVAKILAAGKSPRYKTMEQYEKYWDGSIYEGRAEFFDNTSDTPLNERAPCVVYPIVRSSIQSHVSLCLGDKRFPEILSLTNEDDHALDERFGLNNDESAVVDGVNKKICEQARLPAAAQQALECAMVTGTVATVVAVRNGKICISHLDAKTCTPKYSITSPDELDSVEVKFRYTEDVFSTVSKKWVKCVYQYRRVIDRKSDTTFIPVQIEQEDQYPVPSTPDTSRTVQHNLGFVPVHWYKFKSKIAESGDIDGRPVHWGLASQIDALNFSLSQRHRAARYCGEPQMWEAGVAGDEAPGATGRQSGGSGQSAANPGGFGRSGSPSQVTRKKGPGTVWTYENPDAKAGMLSLPGDALKSIDLDADDLRAKLCEALAWSAVDPMMLRGSADISGKALLVIYERQVNFCNNVREDFGACYLLPILNLVYRIIMATPKGLYLAGVDKLRPILARFMQKDDQGTPRWFTPTIKLQWGDYFEPSDIDEKTRVEAAMGTWQKNGITTKTMLQHIKSVFSIENVDQYAEELEKDTAARSQKLVAQSAAMAAATGKLKPAGQPDDKKPDDKKSPPSQTQGSASRSAAQK